MPNMNSDPLPSIPPIQIHTERVAQLSHNIQEHKANGPDNLPACFLKEVADKIAPALTIIFQASLDQGSLPAIWKTAVVVPIFKKGKKPNPCNYRPISLTCIHSKILEHIVHSSTSHHLDLYGVLCDEQHGFRQKRSCVTQLIMTINDFAECLNQKG